MQPEKWVPVPNEFGRCYSVSSLGRIRRDVGGGPNCKVGHILKPWVDRRGYERVCLCDGSADSRRRFKIHLLVAEAFLGPRPDGKQVNHKDGRKRNNDRENLEYVTPLENTRHAVAIGLMGPPRILLGPARTGRRLPHGTPKGNGVNYKLDEERVKKIRAALARGTLQRIIAARYGVSKALIGHIHRGRVWRAA